MQNMAAAMHAIKVSAARLYGKVKTRIGVQERVMV
jgi:predicted porin